MNIKDFIKITKGTLEEKPQIVQMPSLNYEWADSANHRWDRKWFFSEQGQKAFYSADNYRKKHFYFFNYLYSLFHDNSVSEKTNMLIMNIASIIAYAAGSSDLEFGKYPDILSEDKNPLVKFIVSEDLTKYEKDAIKEYDFSVSKYEFLDGDYIDLGENHTSYLFAIFDRILCYFHKGTEPEDFYDPSRKPYDRLFKLKEEGSNTLLNIERMIIWMFSDVRSCYIIDDNNNYIIIGNGPFVYQYTLD